MTIRLPYDEYREVAVRARARNWSLSDYVGYCVVRELSPKDAKAHVTTRAAEHVVLRDFGDAFDDG